VYGGAEIDTFDVGDPTFKRSRGDIGECGQRRPARVGEHRRHTFAGFSGAGGGYETQSGKPVRAGLITASEAVEEEIGLAAARDLGTAGGHRAQGGCFPMVEFPRQSLPPFASAAIKTRTIEDFREVVWYVSPRFQMLGALTVALGGANGGVPWAIRALRSARS
jgi:hypothetical protein